MALEALVGGKYLQLLLDSVLTSVSLPLKDRIGDQRGGSEWEPIKILLEGD
jgi:hypothetical protein